MTSINLTSTTTDFIFFSSQLQFFQFINIHQVNTFTYTSVDHAFTAQSEIWRRWAPKSKNSIVPRDEPTYWQDTLSTQLLRGQHDNWRRQLVCSTRGALVERMAGCVLHGVDMPTESSWPKLAACYTNQSAAPAPRRRPEVPDPPSPTLSRENIWTIFKLFLYFLAFLLDKFK